MKEVDWERSKASFVVIKIFCIFIVSGVIGYIPLSKIIKLELTLEKHWFELGPLIHGFFFKTVVYFLFLIIF